MSFIRNYLARKLIYENHPTIDEKHCLNRVQSKKLCKICHDVCPHHVFDSDNPNWNLCDDCEICAAVCPTRCIIPSALYSSKIVEIYTHPRETISFSCHEQSEPAEMKLSCLAALPWEILAMFSLQGHINLHCQSCEICSKKTLFEYVKKTLEAVSFFLGAEHYTNHIHIVESLTGVPATNYTRREAFSALFVKSKSAIGNLLPDLGNLPPENAIWRQLLIYRLKQSEPPFSSHWCIPSFTRDCNACGLCIKLCPCQALHRIADENQRDRWFMALIPWRCTGCNLCYEGCPEKGILAASDTLLENPQKPILLPIHMATCKRCKNPMPQKEPQQLCARCRGELGQKIVW